MYGACLNVQCTCTCTLYMYFKAHYNFIFIIVQVIEESMAAYVDSNREEWVVSWPGQAVLCVSQSYWTTYVTESIRNGSDALKTYLELNNSQIENIVALVRGKLNKQNRTTLGALIVLDVHSRDVLTKLVKESNNKFFY